MLAQQVNHDMLTCAQDAWAISSAVQYEKDTHELAEILKHVTEAAHAGKHHIRYAIRLNEYDALEKLLHKRGFCIQHECGSTKENLIKKLGHYGTGVFNICWSEHA